MGYKSGKWTPLNIYILYMICKLRSFHILPPNTQQPFLTSQNEKRFSSCQNSVGCEFFFSFCTKRYNQSGRKWQPFGERKNGHKSFRQTRICTMQQATFCPRNTVFDPKEHFFLPTVFQKMRKSRQIIISRQYSVC